MFLKKTLKSNMHNACHLSLAVHGAVVSFLCLTKPQNSHLSLLQVLPFISGVFNVIKVRSIPVMSLSTLLSCYQNHFPYLCCSAPLLGSTGCQFGKLNIPKAIFITLGLHISIIIFPFFDANSSSTLQCCKLLQWAHHW